jgi:hypothetical protein
MDYFRSHSLSSDDGIVAAWESVAGTAEIPSLRQLIAQRGAELFPEFSRRYTEVKLLPRSARRALQRSLANSRELADIPAEWRAQVGLLDLPARHCCSRSAGSAHAFIGGTIHVGPAAPWRRRSKARIRIPLSCSCTQGNRQRHDCHAGEIGR